MQINQAVTGLRILNDHPVLRPPSTQRKSAESTAASFFDGPPTPKPVVQVPPDSLRASFGRLLRHLGGPLPPVPEPPIRQSSPLGAPPNVDKLGTRVDDYRDTLDAVHADLITQLKSARETLKAAHQSGDQDAITTARAAINALTVQITANRDSLSVVHDDVKQLRELRQQLSTDVKAGNLDVIQQDRDAITQQRAQVLADLQA
jgi:hypothetical protein